MVVDHAFAFKALVPPEDDSPRLTFEQRGEAERQGILSRLVEEVEQQSTIKIRYAPREIVECVRAMLSDFYGTVYGYRAIE